MRISGTTQVFGLIGDPVEHSLSPAIQNAAFESLGVDAVYTTFHVEAGLGAEAVKALRTLSLGGLNVTMPLKQEAYDACDRHTDRAKRIGVANTVVLDAEGFLLGDSTDGDGLILSLGVGGVDVGGKDVMILGAGGAAVSIADALVRSGAEVAIAGRTPRKAEGIAARVRGVRAVLWEEREVVASEASVVINATPLGMGSNTETPLDAGLLSKNAIVVETVYSPIETPFLASARAAGLVALDGLGMLVGQAVLAVELFVGERPEYSTLYDAGVHALQAPSI